MTGTFLSSLLLTSIVRLGNLHVIRLNFSFYMVLLKYFINTRFSYICYIFAKDTWEIFPEDSLDVSLGSADGRPPQVAQEDPPARTHGGQPLQGGLRSVTRNTYIFLNLHYLNAIQQ